MLGNLVHFERIVAECLLELLGESLAVLHDEVLHREHIYIDVCVAGVVDSVPCDREAWRIVGRSLHLVGVPVCLQVRQVANTCIGTLALNLLAVPKRECVIVTACEDDRATLVGQGVEVVQTKVTARKASAAVVVVPCL